MPSWMTDYLDAWNTHDGQKVAAFFFAFWVFLVMGATSLGGGVVGYLRTGLVARQRWLDDVTFVELLSISQTLPGLNATNMSILVGDRLRGWHGALLAMLGMCLPGAALMTAAAFAYGVGGDDPWSKAFLHGIAAGAVGLIVVVMVQPSEARARAMQRERMGQVG